MAEVTEALVKKYAEWSHAELVQEIADAMESLAQAKKDVEEAGDERDDAIRRAEEAEMAQVEAERDRDDLQEHHGDLEDELRYAEGMKLPTAPVLRRSLEILQGKHPHTMTPLL